MQFAKSKALQPLPIAFNLIVAAVLLVMHIRLSPYAFDDAFIHFRVARNLLETGEPYFNEGEPVKVSSSSGWILVLTGSLAVTRFLGLESQFPVVLSIFNAVMLFLGMWIFVRILEALLKRRLTFSERLLFQIQYVALLMIASWGLMETGFALTLTGLGIHLLLRAKPWGIIIASWAVFIRLELIILLALVFVLLVVQKKNGLRLFAYMLLGILPPALYDWHFYRTLIPQSMTAKPIVFSIERYQSFFDFLLNSLPKFSINGVWILLIFGIITITYLLITLLIAASWRKSQIGAWTFLFSICAFVVASAYIYEHVFIFEWYRPLYMVPMIVAGGLCLYSTDKQRSVLRILHYSICFICMVAISTAIYASLINPAVLSSYFEIGSRVRVYQKVGTFLFEYYPRANLMTSEIGGLGYTFRGKIIDAAGLASPEAVNYHPLQIPEQRSSAYIGAIPPEFVRKVMPDLIVSFDIFTEALLKDDVVNQYNQILIPAFLPDDEARSVTKMIWGSDYLRIYVRKGLPIPEGFE